ncbi:hypothetical protein EVB81_220 [Rhizobium phage RHph_I46]|uniref:Lipoprotein n=1 Tax=Rhizobium phage RHph_I1_9 TaxID=2509729 RepID=A0A7S5R9N3_9CAUD|nr:hypothetical protein PP936_gp218 [Rhizobium phage RHph_I1_9]QIG69789.1 hypothetical protein EVB81_220 [Rhizobium phage RHph_I46]QIG71070.1 hypothetical protein EVB92_220 [Rhizobium phage RHph_I9]QIG73655.1 hypothetical protein EVC04_218 [Rhizobium phage RHph_I1_9]QIG76409.1 hypothetical protein EVC25_220 [Rhizobium phage RHph_I34]
MKTLKIACLSSLMLLAACEPSQPSTTSQNAKAVEGNQQRLQTAQPAPRIDVSIERRNLIERLKRLNTENMNGYIYLISMGRVVAQYPTNGKPTSLNSYLMAAEAPQSDPNTSFDNRQSIMVEQPDYDGAYGQNSDGIFFFTADSNAYVEWHGEYIFSDQPLSLNGQPLMTREVK